MKNIYEVEGEDLRVGKGRLNLVRAPNVSQARKMFAKSIQVNPRFLKVKARKVDSKQYPELPKKQGVY